jgi:hypothetical protein
VYAYETKITNTERKVSFVPTKEYIKLTAAIREYLISTSILLNFTSTLQKQLVSVTPPLRLHDLSTVLIDNLYYVNFSSVASQGPYSRIASRDPKIHLGLTISTEPSVSGSNLVYLQCKIKLTIQGQVDERRYTGFIERVTDNNKFEDSKINNDLPPPFSGTSEIDLLWSGRFERKAGNFALSFVFAKQYYSSDPSKQLDAVSFKITELLISYTNPHD